MLPCTGLPLKHARGMVQEGMSPGKYAARWAHTIACFSLDDYRYRDPQVQAWIHSLGVILFQGPGALEDLRTRFLTAAEREAIREEEERGEFSRARRTQAQTGRASIHDHL